MNHHITVCTSCHDKETDKRPGFKLIERLRNALNTSGNQIPEPFSVSGVACMSECKRPCTVAYHGPEKALYLFGDIEVENDLDDLISFAKQYAYLHDGQCSSMDRPGKLRKTTLARIAALPAVQKTED